jgi:hypothetical protein
MSKQIENSMIIDCGDGYKLRAAYKEVGAFEFFVVDWEHSNVGYFTEAFFFWRGLHMSDWKIIKLVRRAKKYKSIKDFLSDYPCFKNFLSKGSLNGFSTACPQVRRPTLPNAEPFKVFPMCEGEKQSEH